MKTRDLVSVVLSLIGVIFFETSYIIGCRYTISFTSNSYKPYAYHLLCELARHQPLEEPQTTTHTSSTVSLLTSTSSVAGTALPSPSPEDNTTTTTTI